MSYPFLAPNSLILPLSSLPTPGRADFSTFHQMLTHRKSTPFRSSEPLELSTVSVISARTSPSLEHHGRGLEWYAFDLSRWAGGVETHLSEVVVVGKGGLDLPS